MYMVSFIVKLKIFKFVLYWFRIYEMTQHICGTFHQYSMCGCEIFKIFKFVLYWFSIYEIIHFWDFLGSYSPKHCLIMLKLWPDVVSNKKNSFWKILQKSWVFAEMECSWSLQFWSILAPNLPSENQKYC